MSTRTLILERLSAESPPLTEPTKPSQQGYVGFVGSSSLGIFPEKIEEGEILIGGAVVLRHPTGGMPIAYENDPPHIRVFAWALINLLFVPWEVTDLGKIARDCALSFSDARKGLARLVQDGDLKVERDRRKEYYWLAPLRYSNKTDSE